MNFFVVGVTLIAAGIGLVVCLLSLADKPVLAMLTCGCVGIAGGWTLIRVGWPMRRSKL